MPARRRLLHLAIVLLIGCFCVHAQDLGSLPRYQPERNLSGTVRLWGHGSFKRDFMYPPFGIEIATGSLDVRNFDYSWSIDDSFSLYLQEALLGGSRKWSCDLREFRHITSVESK